MALTKASDILGLEKKVKEIAVPIDSLSSSKVSVDLPDFTATNAAGAFEELKLDISDLSTSILTINQNVNNLINNVENLEIRRVVITQPSITINADSIFDYDIGVDLEDNEIIVGCAPRYAGLPEFVITNTFPDSSKNVKVTILNPTNSSHVSTGNIDLLLFTKKTTLTKKKTTKKGGK